MKNKLKNTRAVTYRRYGIPALILEGKWLMEKYRLLIGDVVDIDYQPKEIRLKKNPSLSKERQQMLKNKKEIRRQRIELNQSYDNRTQESPQTRNLGHPVPTSTEHRGGESYTASPR